VRHDGPARSRLLQRRRSLPEALTCVHHHRFAVGGGKGPLKRKLRMTLRLDAHYSSESHFIFCIAYSALH
jgi:hypothetical protein